MTGKRKDRKTNLPMSNLYSIIVESQGGTYIHQSRGGSPEAAILSLDPRTLDGNEKENLTDIYKCLREVIVNGDSLVPVSGNVNVWCLSTANQGKLILTHVILTEPRREETEGN